MQLLISLATKSKKRRERESVHVREKVSRQKVCMKKEHLLPHLLEDVEP